MYTFHAVVLDTEAVRRILRGEQTALGQPVQRRRRSYGLPGDILWIKERWRLVASTENYGMGPANVDDVCYFADDSFTPDIRWRNAVTMPFDVSRLHLKIESVKLCTWGELSPDELKLLGYKPVVPRARVAFTVFSIHRCLKGLPDGSNIVQTPHWVLHNGNVIMGPTVNTGIQMVGESH